MSAAPQLQGGFAARALPGCSARHLSHLFAAPAARPALLGCFALMAEWQALLDPATPRDVAPVKIAWWQEEVQRLSQGGARHPISLYLASLRGVDARLFLPLQYAIEAVATESAGVPLEQASDLAAHAMALIGIPLRLAATLGTPGQPVPDTASGLPALAEAEYLARSLRDYRSDARAGRVPFAVAELLAAGIETPALAAATPTPALGAYLELLRGRALEAYRRSQADIAPALRAPLRHQAVLAALGAAHLKRRGASRLAPLKDMLLAWNAARRAVP